MLYMALNNMSIFSISSSQPNPSPNPNPKPDMELVEFAGGADLRIRFSSSVIGQS